MPEPTLFGAPPPGATAPEQLAFYSYYAGMATGAIGAGIAFARCATNGVQAGIAAGFGMAAIAGGAFVSQHLYNNFLYQEAARSATETGLFVTALGAGLVTAAIGLTPGYTSRLGRWQYAVVPALAAGGCALAGVGNLPAITGAGAKALTVGGGLLLAAAGLIVFLERRQRGQNIQDRMGMPIGMGMTLAGLLLSAGATMTTDPESLAKGALTIALAQAIFAGFVTMGLLSVVKHIAPQQAVRRPTVAGPGAAIPPPPGVTIPPPAPGAPRMPAAPNAPVPPPPTGAAPAPAPARAPAPAPGKAPAPAPAPRPGIQKPPQRP